PEVEHSFHDVIGKLIQSTLQEHVHVCTTSPSLFRVLRERIDREAEILAEESLGRAHAAEMYRNVRPNTTPTPTSPLPSTKRDPSWNRARLAPIANSAPWRSPPAPRENDSGRWCSTLSPTCRCAPPPAPTTSSSTASSLSRASTRCLN